VSQDPPRLAEQAPDELRALMRASREVGPDADSIHRMAMRLSAAGALASAPEARESRAPRTGRLAALARGAVALAVAGGLAVSWQASQPSSTRADSAAPISSTSSDSAAAMAARHRHEPEPRDLAANAALDEESSPAPMVSVDHLPEAIAPTPSPRPSTREERRPKAPSTVAARAAESELELLQRAQATLSSDPARALAIASEQARAYPTGEFIQEREVIAVEALARLDRKDEALRRARALVERFPRTPYGDRLELAVGRTL